MAFQKKVWVDRVSEYPTRRILHYEDGTTAVATLERHEGEVSKGGTPINETNMNDLESRIESAFSEASTKETSLSNQINANGVPFQFGVDANGRYGYKKAGADTVIPFNSGIMRSLKTLWLFPERKIPHIPYDVMDDTFTRKEGGFCGTNNLCFKEWTFKYDPDKYTDEYVHDLVKIYGYKIQLSIKTTTATLNVGTSATTVSTVLTSALQNMATVATSKLYVKLIYINPHTYILEYRHTNAADGLYWTKTDLRLLIVNPLNGQIWVTASAAGFNSMTEVTTANHAEDYKERPFWYMIPLMYDEQCNQFMFVYTSELATGRVWRRVFCGAIKGATWVASLSSGAMHNNINDNNRITYPDVRMYGHPFIGGFYATQTSATNYAPTSSEQPLGAYLNAVRTATTEANGGFYTNAIGKLGVQYKTVGRLDDGSWVGAPMGYVDLDIDEYELRMFEFDENTYRAYYWKPLSGIDQLVKSMISDEGVHIVDTLILPASTLLVVYAPLNSTRTGIDEDKMKALVFHVMQNRDSENPYKAVYTGTIDDVKYSVNEEVVDGTTTTFTNSLFGEIHNEQFEVQPIFRCALEYWE